MAIGERIRFLRNLKVITQKWLCMAVGFDEKTADIRMAQYESGTRTPKENLTNDLAKVLEVSPAALIANSRFQLIIIICIMYWVIFRNRIIFISEIWVSV